MDALIRRVRIDLAYDGTGFAGWQFQPAQRTVQGVVERALCELQGGRPLRLDAASRTDSGVHARGQVADCPLRSRLDDRQLGHALSRLLPPDVRPLRVRTVPWGFHARKQALEKIYHYRLDLTPAGDPFLRRFALHHPRPLDLPLLREALARLPGRRDWSGFTSSRCDKADRVRHLRSAAFETSSAAEGRFTFSSDGFLRYMVRNLVGTLLRIGTGRMPVARIDEILRTRDRGRAGPTAPPHGLCLARVVYAEDLVPGGESR